MREPVAPNIPRHLKTAQEIHIEELRKKRLEFFYKNNTSTENGTCKENQINPQHDEITFAQPKEEGHLNAVDELNSKTLLLKESKSTLVDKKDGPVHGDGINTIESTQDTHKSASNGAVGIVQPIEPNRNNVAAISMVVPPLLLDQEDTLSDISELSNSTLMPEDLETDRTLIRQDELLQQSVSNFRNSSVISETESKSLQNVLGIEKYKQLIQNLHDSETFDDETEILVHQSREVWHHDSGKVQDEDLELQTHRPTYEVSAVAELNITDPAPNDHVKFAYNSQEIYAQAGNNNTEKNTPKKNDLDSDSDISAFVYPTVGIFENGLIEKKLDGSVSSGYSQFTSASANVPTWPSDRKQENKTHSEGKDMLTRESLEIHNAYMSQNGAKGTDLDKTRQEEFKMKLAQMEDDLFTTVTSVVDNLDDVALSERIGKLGVDFHFLRNEKSSDSKVSRNSRLESVEEDDASLLSTESTRGMIVECKECGHHNKVYVTWCVECGATVKGLVRQNVNVKSDGIEHVQIHINDNNVNRENGSEEGGEIDVNAENVEELSHSDDSSCNSSVKEHLEIPMKQSTGSGDDRAADIKIESLSSALKTTTISFKLNTGSVDGGSTASKNQSTSAPFVRPLYRSQEPTSSHVQRVRDESNVLHDSDEFVYNDIDKKPSPLPPALKAELSIDVRGSYDSDAKPVVPVISDSDSEDDIKFEYVDNDATPKLNQREKSELQLDLGDSITSNDFKENSSVQKADETLKDSPPIENNSLEDDVYVDNSSSTDDEQDSPDKSPDRQDAATETNHYVAQDESLYRREHMPQQSSAGPQIANSVKRPQSANQSRPLSASKVRASIEAPPHKRRWQSSSLAWNSYHPNDFKSRSLLSVDAREKLHRPVSASSAFSGPRRTISNLRPQSAGAPRNKASNNLYKTQEFTYNPPNRARSPITEKSAKVYWTSSQYTCKKIGLLKYPNKNAMQTYTKYMEMSPRVIEGTFSLWLCLPDEIWLYILSFLSHQHLARVALTCSQLCRIADDKSLWTSISLKKSSSIKDSWLACIGRRRPRTLCLVQCKGGHVTTKGPRELFRNCDDSLQELCFTGCTHGYLTGDHLMLHAAARCTNLTAVDASWCNINDNGILALVEGTKRLEKVSFNGCQPITDEAISALVVKHGIFLKELEIFCCFNITAQTVVAISKHCRGLLKLNLGQCWKITDSSLFQLSASLTLVQILDLRGCKQIKDRTVKQILRTAEHLDTLSLANCSSLTDNILLDIAAYSPKIRSLDLSGCKGLTDAGFRQLCNKVVQLEYLDLSSTAISHKSVTTIANYCGQKLQVVKLNFCKHLTIPSLTRLAKHCVRLKKLYLYGVGGTCMRDIALVQRARTGLWIEM